jgi:hypothetical protein
MQGIRQREAAGIADTDPRIGLRHRRGDHFLGQLDLCHGTADQFRRETARPRSPAPSTRPETTRALRRAFGHRTSAPPVSSASPPSRRGRRPTSNIRVAWRSRGAEHPARHGLHLQTWDQRRLRQWNRRDPQRGLGVPLRSQPLLDQPARRQHAKHHGARHGPQTTSNRG